MKNKICNFHGTKMTIHVLTGETDGMYSVIHFEHPPNVGPALHIHPRGPESFHIIDGKYQFLIGDKTIDVQKGDTITVPKGVSHKFNSGNDGGQFLVISPPGLENYFYEVSQLLSKGMVDWSIESEIARKYGQIFLETSNHWASA
ncbi:MAG: cupin domain-containing protein [Thaumarchaeota archaeon]|nr:cupin domain-containing protein [Nitrososphaerota archaeon]